MITQLDSKNKTVSGNGSADTSSLPAPFTRASRLCSMSGQTRTLTLSIAQQSVALQVPTGGYIAYVLLEVISTTSGNAAATAFNADGPWNVLNRVIYQDSAGTPLVNLKGYSCYVAARHGGYRLFTPEGSTRAYSVTTGAGATGGSFSFYLPLYSEFGRDALGARPNMDARSQYTLNLTFDTIATVYSTAPTNAPTITVRPIVFYWSNPPLSTDGQQNATTPPAVGTTQYWSSQTYEWSAAGEQTVQFVRVGNLIRGHLFIIRNASGARSATPAPSTYILEWDDQIMLNEPTLSRDFVNYTLGGIDPPVGVYTFMRTADPENLPISEYGDGWLKTSTGTKLLLRFTSSAAGSLEILTNDIVPVGSIFRY